ncbi:MAG: hypothetical protein A2Z07_11450 [Armatimonadetes bacterium RBG_16_67_12]|nr:MAG: hypothetical protein A2Z07_11450 [Armatimonadetes bacterium RBG_16_67_12]
MIAEAGIRPTLLPRRRRIGQRHRLRAGVPVARGAWPVMGVVWARFWDDRQAVRLKVILLAGCLLAAMWLEVPW